jgi:glyoxylase-like metal-dependent hydrolase (beta-lactamase superfamily II)
MQTGKFNIDVVDTGLFGLDGGSMFGIVPKVLWSKAYNPGDERNRIPLAARPLLVRWDNYIVLIDTGNGNKFNDKFADIYGIDREKSSIVAALKPFGVIREDVTHVILTHLHFDHTGGSTIIENGKLVPTFPNAVYYVQKDQFISALHPNDKERPSFIKENYEPLVTEGKLETIDGEGEIFPGILAIPVFGHTKAMQLLKISDAGQTLLYCADVVPTSAHVHVPYYMSFDNNPLQTIKEKKILIPQAYEEGWTLVYEHDAFIQAGKLKSTEKGFANGESVIITI